MSDKKSNRWHPIEDRDAVLTSHYTCPGIQLQVHVDRIMENGLQCRVTAYDECPVCHIRFGSLLVANSLLEPVATP